VSSPVARTNELIPGYTIKDRIGAGGYGEVWRAEAPGGLEKAVKFVYGYLDEERAARERKALNRIKEVRHPFILSMERIEVVDSQLVAVMELADLSLKDRFEACQRSGQRGIPHDELLVYLGDAADALDYMSERHSLQHLDVKPENLLIVGGRVKVADFGLVKDVHEATVSLMGGLTPVYAPPEVFDGRPSLKSDQYSLAIVYQEMLTGALPFPGRTASQLAAQHLHSPPRLAVLARSDQPIIARALSKDPEERFPNCRAMVDALLGRGDSAGVIRTGARDGQLDDPDCPSDTTSATCEATYVVRKPDSTPGPDDDGREAPEPYERRSGPAVPDGSSRTQQVDLGKSPLSGRATGDQPAAGMPRNPQHASREAPDALVQRTKFPGPQAPAPAKELPPIEIAPEECGLRPTLFVGIGGTAARALRRLRRRMHHRFGSDVEVPAFRLLLIDTDCKTLADAGQGAATDAIDPGESIPVPLQRPQDYRRRSEGLLSWLSRRWLYNIPRSLRTEGLRPLGRLAFVDHAPEIVARIRDAIASITAPNALSAASARTGLKVRSDVPRVFVVSSISGGTGSGMVLDVGYAVRHVLHDLGLPDDGVCGILTHSSGRNPHERDLAVANAYACLSELQHYGRTSHYPGDSASGLPAFSHNVAPFRATYFVPLGSDLDETQFESAVDGLAEYLFVDAATAGGAFFDKCRESEHVLDGPASTDLPLRTFGIWHFGRTLSDGLAGAAEALGKRVIRRWRDDPGAGREPPGTPPSTSPTNDGAAHEARSESGEIHRLAHRWVDEHNLHLEPLIEAAIKAIGVRLSDDPEAFFRKMLARLLPNNHTRDSGSKSRVPGEKILAAINAALGPRNVPDGFQTDLQHALQAELDKQLENAGRTLQDDVCAWILRWVDSPDAGAGAARRAGEWFAQHLRSLEAEICREQPRIEGALEEMERILLSAQPPDQAQATRRFGIARRSKKTPSLEPQWLDYWGLRLSWLAIPGVLRIVRSLAAQVNRVLDLITNLQRELGLIGDAFDESAFQAVSHLSRVDAPDPPDEVRSRLVRRISSQMSRLAAEVDGKVRSELCDKNGGLCEVLTQRQDCRRSLISAIRQAARGALLEVLREMDLTQLLLCPHHEGTPNGGLGAYLEASAPELSTCGGAKRLLAVLPEGVEDGPIRDAAQQYGTESPSVVFDPDYDVILCWESEQLPLSAAAATVIDCRIDYAQVAARLHCRTDVSWTSLAGL